ncbi:ankyrin repeat domain-containing protein [Flavobacterium enshiense]|uniref:ankyrin repeat domain-containing protein n=1 Tax=Flavobacterium enshiense TaxID=1341165 RepID=UPI00345CC6A5
MIPLRVIKKILIALTFSIFLASCNKEKFTNKESEETSSTAEKLKDTIFNYDKNASAIREYIIKGDYKKIERFIQNKGDVNLRCKGYLRAGRDIPETKHTDENWTLLMLAIFENEIEIAQLLIKNKADINAKNAVGHTALFLACAHNYEKEAKLLLEHNAKVTDTGKDPDGMSALQWALTYDLNDVAEELIERGADVNTYASDIDRTILMEAFFSDSIQPQVIHKIIDAGADLTIKTKDKETALMFACTDNDIIAVKKILAANTDINAESKNGQTALCYAARNKTQDTVLLELLVAKGAKINTNTIYGRNALIEAVSSGSIEKVKFLVEKGALVNKKSEGFGGVSPLSEAVYWATHGKADEIVQYLIENKADVNIKRDNRESSLLVAIQSDEKYETVKLLIEKGAKVNDSDDENTTPLMKAVKYNLYKITKLLLENDAKTNITDVYGKNILHHAKETAERTGDDSILKLIQSSTNKS